MNRFRTSRAGIAVTELAVCLPIIMALVFGTFEACSMIYLRQSLSIAAYEGARVAIVPGTLTDDARYQTEMILDARGVHDFTVNVTPNLETATVGTFIAVNVSAPCEANSILGGWFYQDRRIDRTVQMMKED